MNDIFAGDPYLKGKSDVDECIYVTTPLKFGVFVTKDATTGDPVIDSEGKAIWISGWTSCNKDSKITQVFWKEAVSIYVQCVSGISTGDVLYVIGDGTGFATNDPAKATANYIPVGIAKSDTTTGFIDRNMNTGNLVKMDWTGLSAPIVVVTPPPALKTKKNNIKEV